MLTNNVAAQHIQDLYLDSTGNVEEGYTRVANNLPGVMQYLDLVRDAGYAFGLPDLPENKVDGKDELTGRDYADEDNKLSRNGSLAYPYDEEKQKRTREMDKQKRQKKKEMMSGGESKKTKEKKAAHVTEESGDEAEKEESDDERDDVDSVFDISEASDEDEGEVEEAEEDEEDLWPRVNSRKAGRGASKADEEERLQKAIAASFETMAEETRRIAAEQEAGQNAAEGAINSAQNGVGEAMDEDDEDEMMQRAIAASFDPTSMGGDGGVRVSTPEQAHAR